MNDAPIGVYDSGLGGLTVWREVRRMLPSESLVYLGDGKNCPYGSRPREEVRRLADEAVASLVAQGCKERPNRDLTRFTAQIQALIDRWEK